MRIVLETATQRSGSGGGCRTSRVGRVSLNVSLTRLRLFGIARDAGRRVSSQPLARGRRREWENRWRPCPVRLAAPQHAPSHTHPSLARLSSAPKTSINHYKGHVYHAHPERHSAGRNSLQVQGQSVGEFACFILHARQYQSPPPLLITLGHRLPCHLVLTTCLTLPGDWELNVDKVWAVPYDRAYL